MAYRVELTDRACRDLASLYEEKHAGESKAAAAWFNGLEDAVNSLASLPRRCPSAPESKQARQKLRHLLYGKRSHVYRVIFQIDEPHKVVNVLTLRHAAMEIAAPEDLR